MSKRITHKELITEVAAELGIPREQAQEVLDMYLAKLKEKLLIGGSVQLTNFVVIEPVQTAESSRMLNGKRVKVPAKTRLKITASEGFAQDLNGDTLGAQMKKLLGRF